MRIAKYYGYLPNINLNPLHFICTDCLMLLNCEFIMNDIIMKTIVIIKIIYFKMINHVK
jgi:hypothetical protein